MTTITKQLADALRAVIDTAPGGVSANGADNSAAKRDGILALVAYDAQQAQPVAAGAWSANAGSVWDHTGKWVADCNREHAARIVQCVNAHDALVSALRTILADKGSASFNHDLEAYDAAIQTASDALAQAGVNHA